MVKKTGMDFADAFAQVKGKLGAQSREAKGVALLDPEEQLEKLEDSDDTGGNAFR